MTCAVARDWENEVLAKVIPLAFMSHQPVRLDNVTNVAKSQK